MGMDRAPAGAKRISNLLHSRDWEAKLLDDWMWAQGDRKIEESLHPQDDTMPFGMKVRSKSRRV
jgi:hypothetical protein